MHPFAEEYLVQFFFQARWLASLFSRGVAVFIVRKCSGRKQWEPSHVEVERNVYLERYCEREICLQPIVHSRLRKVAIRFATSV